MSAMLAAIQKRKAGGQSVLGDHQDATHKAEHAIDPETQKDLHGLVAGLSEGEKHSLKQILDSQKTDGQAIAKGGASTEEQGKINDAMAQENQENSLEEQEENGQMSPDKSDQIAMSMLDTRHKNGMATEKPRNLGERMKQSLAGKLKAKGKL